MDWLFPLSGQIDQGTSLQEDNDKGIKNVYRYKTNQCEKETQTPEPMSVTTRRNETISSIGKNLAILSTAINNRHILLKKKVPSGYCPSLPLNKQTPVSGNRDQGTKVNDLPSSRHDPNLNTIKNWLHRFGKPTILPTLENSLTQVKRKKISPESHEDLSKSIDKELQKLTRTFHPDRAGDNEWQAALNTIRVVLKTLTEVFLENLFIDYKYEYFSRLDVRVLINENERNTTIQKIFSKISVYSETKRMNILGEIRKFLIESEKCVESFFNDNESDFMTFRDYALYHLRKSIEGYKVLEREWNLLIEGCSSEDDNMRGVVQNMVDESLKEWSILRKVEQSARRSFQGNFEIFPVQKYMDEYYILPFVDYVNVLSMCSLLLQPERSSFFAPFSKVNIEFTTDDDRNHFLIAYHLAYGIYLYKISKKKTRGNLDIYIYLQKLHKTLETIFRKVLQTHYKVDVYREGKNNRTKILDLKDCVKDVEEKGNTFIEHVNQYILKKETSDSGVNYRQDEEGSFEVGMTKERKIEELEKINFPPEREKSLLKIERNKFLESVVNYGQEERKNSKVNMKNGEKESEEGWRKLTLRLEGEENQCKMETKKIGESVLNCTKDEDEMFEVDMINGEKRNEYPKKLTSPLEGEENQNKMATKCYESVLNCRQDEEVNMPVRENEREINSSNPNSLSEGEKIPEESQESIDITWALKGFVVDDEVAEECLNQLDYQAKHFLLSR